MARIINPPEDLFDLPLDMRPLRIQRNKIERERDRLEQMVCDYNARGKSIRDIAEALGYRSSSQVQKILDKHT